MRALMGAPMGAMTFFGSLMALPATVTVLRTRGTPVMMYFAMAARVVQLITMTPTSRGSFPSGTVRPVRL